MVVGMRRAWRYDVLLSFRGSDVRKGFVDHLYRALTARKEIHVFHDAHQVKKGENIHLSVKHAIECSPIRIPIFSPDFATSLWCLNEVSLIASQVQGTTIPLFYKVTPSQVRHPERSDSPFAQAFQHHHSSEIHKPEEIEIWKAALVRMSNLAGWKLDDTNGWVH